MVEMIEVSFTDAEGAIRVVIARDGESLMQAAVRSDIHGIAAECGGACACATCHVYIDPVWLEPVGKPGSMEADMLEFADNVRESSRLACQVRITDRLHGLKVVTPAA